jgi:hypothetical protein
MVSSCTASYRAGISASLMSIDLGSVAMLTCCMENINELQRWEDLRKAAMDLGFYATIDRHKIVMHPSMTKITALTKGMVALHSLDELAAWLDGYRWMADYAKQLGWDQQSAEKITREELDRQRIYNVLSKE